MWVSALAAASFTVDYEVTASGELAAQASTVLVPVDPATFRPRRLDETERAYLSRFLVG
jgi:acyl-CoA thioester hydrolase